MLPVEANCRVPVAVAKSGIVKPIAAASGLGCITAAIVPVTGPAITAPIVPANQLLPVILRVSSHSYNIPSKWLFIENSSANSDIDSLPAVALAAFNFAPQVLNAVSSIFPAPKESFSSAAPPASIIAAVVIAAYVPFLTAISCA